MTCMNKRLLLFVLLIGTAFSAAAQQKQNLTSVLNKLSTAYKVTFSFSPKLTDPVHPSCATVSGKSVESDLQAVLKGTNFTYKKINATYYQIIPQKAKPTAAKPAPKPEPKKEPEPVAVIPPEPAMPAEPEEPEYRWALKTDLLYDISLSLNVGGEVEVAKGRTFSLALAVNPWTFKDGRTLKFFLIQPEYRFWLGGEAFSGGFIGVDVSYANFNIGGYKLPWISDSQYYRYKGWGIAGGATYGYRWDFFGNFSIEAFAGLSLYYASCDKWNFGDAGTKVGPVTRFAPILNPGVNLIYQF